jgi:hypothetical protein
MFVAPLLLVVCSSPMPPLVFVTERSRDVEKLKIGAHVHHSGCRGYVFWLFLFAEA